MFNTKFWNLWKPSTGLRSNSGLPFARFMNLLPPLTHIALSQVTKSVLSDITTRLWSFAGRDLTLWSWPRQGLQRWTGSGHGYIAPMLRLPGKKWPCSCSTTRRMFQTTHLSNNGRLLHILFNWSPWFTTLVLAITGPHIILRLVLTCGPYRVKVFVRSVKEHISTVQLMILRQQYQPVETSQGFEMHPYSREGMKGVNWPERGSLHGRLKTRSSGDQACVSTSQNWTSQLLEHLQAYVKGTPPELVKGQLDKLMAKRSRATTIPWHGARIVSLNDSITQTSRDRTHQSRYRSPILPTVPLFGFKTESEN